MAKVFLGRITIPGEKMDNYLEALGNREEEFKPLYFRLPLTLSQGSVNFSFLKRYLFT